MVFVRWGWEKGGWRFEVGDGRERERFEEEWVELGLVVVVVVVVSGFLVAGVILEDCVDDVLD